jgi:LL-diaminopimelate aminotransferase
MNGVSYPVQRAAEAVFTSEGQAQTRELTDGYLANAAIIRSTMEGAGLFCVGGRNAPYVWVQTGRDSWEFFNLLLDKAGVVSTPGSGFGRCGEGYVRFSAFNSRENVERAMGKVKDVLG